jgi:hypothetical protein
MKRITAFFISIVKKALEYPFLWVGVIYFLWFVKPPFLNNENFDDGVRLLGIYAVIVVLEKFLSGNKILSIVLFILILPIAVITGSFLHLIYGTFGRLGSEKFYIPMILLFSGYAAYNLYQKPSSDNKSLRILLFFAILPILSLNIAYPISFFPKIVTQKEFGDFKYYIVWQTDIDYHSYLSFYKCEKRGFNCDRLPTSHMNFDEIIIDKERNEVSAVRGNLGLSYTDGNNPRVYEGYSVQLGNHVYQMAINAREFLNCMKAPSCDSYTYTLYECDLDYTSCDPLPVQYSETNHEYEWGYLDVNEATSEINAYSIKDSLIFTYGENPVCYIDRCVILDH